MKPFIPRILITPGEPAGIGPDIVIQIAQLNIPAELIVVFDPDILIARAKLLNLPLNLTEFNIHSTPLVNEQSVLKIVPVEARAPVFPGQLNPDNALFVIACLELATEYCLEKIADALVTGPVHKNIINQAGISFTGHTEFLADFCKVSQTVMLFVVNQLRVALATTHLPLNAVSRAITHDHLKKTLQLLHRSLQTYFNIGEPRILVCGLNPHAGEGGILGREEQDTISPVIQSLQKEMKVTGPFPADTIFTEHYLEKADAILGMYHDQVLPVVKNIGFRTAVNMTLGLPIIRTSVDHGTALELTGLGKAYPDSLLAAINLAIQLIKPM